VTARLTGLELVELDQRGRAGYPVRVAIVSNLYEAKTNLSQLVDQAAAGEEIIIAKNGVPMARLGPLEVRPAPRAPGGWEHGVVISDDFDAPLPEALRTAFGE
jgi:prevent-host-death family protein